jgi:hypothetical protein
MIRSLSALLLLPLGACASGHHLQYDHGRAYEAALAAQADLMRPAAADGAYPLTGFEGLALRQRATEDATDQESGKAEGAAKTVEVK